MTMDESKRENRINDKGGIRMNVCRKAVTGG